MLKLDTRADLEALHTGSIQESLTLEYKSSGAVEKTEANKMEIAKDAVVVTVPAAASRACVSGSSLGRPISTAICRMRSCCCAREASGQPIVAPPSTATSSRRRMIAPSLRTQGCTLAHQYLWKCATHHAY
jgi:hypothetical protein